MHLAVILAVLTALVAADQTPEQPVAEPLVLAGTVVLLLTAVGLIASCGSATVAHGLRHDVARRRKWLRRFARLKQFYWTLWLAVGALILFGCHWPQVVYRNWTLDRFILADDLALLLPILAPLPIGWLAFSRVDRTLESLAREAGIETPPTSAAAELVMHARLYLGLVLLPIFVLLAAQDIADRLAPNWDEQYGLLVYGPVLAGLLLGLPLALRHIWATRPLAPGTLRDRLLAALDQHGVGVRELLVWETRGRMLNAMVTGLCSPLRYVLLTDVLLKELPDDELEAVVLHEVGHVRRHHFLLRIALLFLPLWWWIVFSSAGSEPLQAWAASGDWLPTEFWLPTVAGIYALFALGGYSRWLEYDADLWSCQHYPEGLERGAQHFATALLRIADLQREKRGSWLHPSSRDRASFVLQVAQNEDRARRFRRQLCCLHGSLLLALLLPPLLALAL